MTVMNFHFHREIGDETARVPAGEYYIIDPCYCFDHDWDDVLEALHLLGNSDTRLYFGEYKGKPMIAMQTAYGDGLYEDQFGNEYGVDAGLIGLVPVDLCPDMPRAWGGAPLGLRVKFDESTEVRRTRRGVLKFGKYRIDTSGSDE